MGLIPSTSGVSLLWEMAQRNDPQEGIVNGFNQACPFISSEPEMGVSQHRWFPRAVQCRSETEQVSKHLT